MKRLVIAAPKLLFILYSLLPLCGIVGGFWGYSDFTLQNCRVSAILLAAGTLALSIPVLIRPRYASGSDVNPFFAAVLLPLLFVNWLFYLHADAWLENFIYMMICLLGSVYFLFIYVFKAYLWTVINRIGASIGTGLIILLFVSAFSFAALFSGIAKNTIVYSAISPDGSHVARLISNDQGALGGYTFVDICESGEIDGYFFRLAKKSTHIYQGEWDDYQHMTISWENDGCLLINGRRHCILHKDI